MKRILIVSEHDAVERQLYDLVSHMFTDEGKEVFINIVRTKNKNRQRPQADSRHKDHDYKDLRESDELKLFNPKDLEWLAWNWRGWQNKKKFSSRK